jgi:hypothetical protein
MRNTVKIFALILLYFMACGKSCDNGEQFDASREQRKVTAETDSLRSAFGTDTLSASSLRAYMETAKQKFYDYNDYLDIVSDTSKAKPFRDKAQKMISSLFLLGTEPSKLTRPISLLNVNMKEPFLPINDSVYSGRLDFIFVAPGKPVYSDVITRDSGVIAVFLVRHDKNFGKEKFRVWDVFLGKTE